jgi:hypothetical protein
VSWWCVQWDEEARGEVTRLEPQDLSVTVELGLCLCSGLPCKMDNQTDRCNMKTDSMMMMICLECYR